jgi:hypothetical protein
MAASLPAYSGAQATCPKCKTACVTTIYHRSRSTCMYAPYGEHQCRVCPNCGYGWPESCADSGGGDQKPSLTLVQDIDEPGVGPGVSHARRYES